MKRIAVFTTTRADFGILSPLIKAIIESNSLELSLFVGGAHLKTETGLTITEIHESGFPITGLFDYLDISDDDGSVLKSFGRAVEKVSEIFTNYKFDLVCVLGDRYELLAIVANAILCCKPIVHIHGGEKSEGAIDEQIRHMITKASHVHFVSCEEYLQNVRNMGEALWRIHNTGALSVDNMKNMIKIDKKVLFENLGIIHDKETILLTYHPVTLEHNKSALNQISDLFEAINEFDFQVVITSPNVDKDGRLIHDQIMKEIIKNKNLKYFKSLGWVNYLSLIPLCKFVIGNSSSGIIEVPFFKIPTINIGDRQNGRILHKSVINTDNSKKSIVDAINIAVNPDFVNSLKFMDYKFGDGTAAHKMIKVLESLEINSFFMQKQLIFQ